MPTEPNQTRKTLSPINSTTWMLVVLSILGLIFAGSVFLATAPGAWFKQNMNWLFAADTVQLWWYVTRAAGIIAYLLLWLSTAWGLVVPAKILDPLIQRWATFDFHQFISLLAIGFLGLHIGVLALDRYLPYSGLQILVPFLSPYRPLWVTISAGGSGRPPFGPSMC